MRSKTLVAIVLIAASARSRGASEIFFDPDRSLAAQERLQESFLGLVRTTHEPPWLIDCLTFDDLALGAHPATGLGPDLVVRWPLDAVPEVMRGSEGIAAYSAPNIFGWRAPASAQTIVLEFSRTFQAAGLWVSGNARGMAAARVRAYAVGAADPLCDIAVPGCTDPAAPSLFFVGVVAAEPIERLSIQGANVVDAYAGIDHVWVARTIPATPVAALRVRWFHCDTGDANGFTLERDGSPMCGLAPCGAIDCWGTPVIARSWSADGIAWHVLSKNTIRMSLAADTFVLTDTWIRPSAAESVPLAVAGSDLAFWIDAVQAPPTEGELALPPLARAQHVEWTCYNRTAPADVWIDIPVWEASIELPGQELYPASIVIEESTDGTTEPPPGRYDVPAHSPFAMTATPGTCRSFSRWLVTGTGGWALEHPESAPENTLTCYGLIHVRPLFDNALGFGWCTWDASLSGIDCTWKTLAAIDAIEVVRDGESLARLPGNAQSWRDAAPPDSGARYEFRPVCGGIAAAPAFSCWAPPRPDAVASSMDIDPGARVSLDEFGDLKAHVRLRITSSATMQGWAFGLQYDEPTWRLERVVVERDENPWYFTYDLAPASTACETPAAPGVTAGFVYEHVGAWGPDVREQDVDLVFAIDRTARRCCPLRFVACLGTPPTQNEIVHDGASSRSAAHDGEACLGLPDACGATGDVNADGRIDIADPVCILGGLFGPPTDQGKLYIFLCPEAADINADARIDIADPIALLARLFRS
jgi:hypothetical protein